MFNVKGVPRSGADAVLAALERSLAIIEFDTKGVVLRANDNFCGAIGYSQAEIKGQHHAMFVEPGYAASPAYREFWAKLGRGEYDAQEYKRIAKGGREIWIQASYNPVRDRQGRVTKVVKVATDITAAKLRNAEFEGKVDAISRAQAVIEFTPRGDILTANENFLDTLGYQLAEITGKHHRLFVEAAYAQSGEYQQFWDRLNGGDFIAAEFKRIGKGGREVWIQASYNPIFDMSGRVVKVVKFATDVTERVRAVVEIGKGLSQLADNNLQYRLEHAFAPAFEDLRADFNRSLDSLQAAMVQIAGSGDTIQSGTAQISDSSSDLSRRTEQQAAALEETAAALDQITATVKRSAESARMANTAASNTKSDAIKSGEVVTDAVAAMDQIEKSSGEITQIIGVIDEIAFQTNLLALNAGVEAARAGEAGRGFAVVAQEVRALAQRSAEAAKQIKTLISSSSEQVKRGVKLVGDTGHALKSIVGKVTEIDSLISEMALSGQEQSTGLSQVNTAVNQMDQVTQQNAAMVEEATAAAMSLKGEADEMARLVSRFKVGAAGARRPQPAAVSSPVARQQQRLVTALKAGGAQPAAQAWEDF